MIERSDFELLQRIDVADRKAPPAADRTLDEDVPAKYITAEALILAWEERDARYGPRDLSGPVLRTVRAYRLAEVEELPAKQREKALRRLDLAL